MSLEGLNSLIQLESTRLEGAKQTSANSQSVGSTVQQQGLSTASSKNSLTLQRIDAQFNKEVAMAEVRKLESRLARERQAEKLALTIAGVVGLGSLASNLWDAGGDLFNSTQKLGERPKALQVTPLDPGNAQILSAGKPGTSGEVRYAVTKTDRPDPEVVEGYEVSGDGSASKFRAATISGEDKVRILGSEKYRNMSFAEIFKESPEKAEFLMADKSHDMCPSECKEFMNVIEGTHGIQSHVFKPDTFSSSGKKAGETLSKISEVTEKAAVKGEFKPDEEHVVPGEKPKKYADMTLAEIKEIARKEDRPELAKRAENIEQELLKKGPQNVFHSISSRDGRETVQAMNIDGSGEILRGEITPKMKREILGPEYEDKSFGEIYTESPEKAKLLFKADNDKKLPEGVHKISVREGEVFAESASGSNSLYNSIPHIERAMIESGKMSEHDFKEWGGRTFDNVKDFGKSLVNVMVNTAQDAVPYFQAYLAARDRADRTQEELIAAMAKLEAANKKLKSIENNIDAFGGKGT